VHVEAVVAAVLLVSAVCSHWGCSSDSLRVFALAEAVHVATKAAVAVVAAAADPAPAADVSAVAVSGPQLLPWPQPQLPQLLRRAQLAASVQTVAAAAGEVGVAAADHIAASAAAPSVSSAPAVLPVSPLLAASAAWQEL